MKHFGYKIVRPFLEESRYTRICEVGASLGLNTERILTMADASMTLIDPCLDADLERKFAAEPRVSLHRGLSLEVLATVDEEFDCILIDGDHNWYTVFNELETVHNRKLLRKGGAILCHDVGWPYARRDMYYQPDTVPAEHRQPFAQRGMVEGQSELNATGGMNPDLFNATHEGGPKNGVLTAIDDFLAAHRGEYEYFSFREEYGLGFIVDKTAAVGAVSLKYRRRARLANTAVDLKAFVRRVVASILNRSGVHSK